MADYSGATSGNITIQDGDTIGATDHLTVTNTDICTIEAGATVEVYSGRYFRTLSSGVINAIGTVDSPITLQSQSADPSYNDWDSIKDSTGLSTFRYFIVKSCERAFEGCDWLNTTIDKVQIIECMDSLWLGNYDSGIDISNIYIYSRYAMRADTNNAEKTGTISKVWCKQSYAFYGYCDFGDTAGLTLDDCVIGGGDCDDESVITIQNCYIRGPGFYPIGRGVNGEVTLTGNIFYRSDYGARILTSGDIISSYNDYIGTYSAALINGATTTTSDYDHFAGCNLRPEYIINTAAQVSGLTSQTNQQANPVHPLEVDNISEGAVGQNSITITYDCKAGTAGSKRLKGLPFIKYGTVSGTYDMQSYLPPPEEWGLYWIEWYTDMEWKQTGHSVTLDNLKPGTTYYYKCCFVDPLGRAGESAEGSFETTGSSGVSSPMPPFWPQ